MEGLRIRPAGTYVDGTLGGGGHAAGIAERIGPQGLLIGIDRDRDALDAAGQRLAGSPCSKLLIQNTYANIREILREHDIPGIDGALLDIGVSSFQLDNPERGFSYMHDAPLDMRMNRDDGFTAYDVINGYEQGRLAEIIRSYGEERWAARLAQFNVKARAEGPIETTGQLMEIIKAAIPAGA